MFIFSWYPITTGSSVVMLVKETILRCEVLKVSKYYIIEKHKPKYVILMGFI